jgi:hypothetical protein
MWRGLASSRDLGHAAQTEPTRHEAEAGSSRRQLNRIVEKLTDQPIVRPANP